MKGNAAKRRNRKIQPSLRRHYPDQVHGFNLSLPALKESTPRIDSKQM